MQQELISVTLNSIVTTNVAVYCLHFPPIPFIYCHEISTNIRILYKSIYTRKYINAFYIMRKDDIEVITLLVRDLNCTCCCY